MRIRLFFYFALKFFYAIITNKGQIKTLFLFGPSDVISWINFPILCAQGHRETTKPSLYVWGLNPFNKKELKIINYFLLIWREKLKFMAEEKSKGNVSQQDKLWGALAYVWVLAIVVLAAKKDSKFAQFHAKQGLILFIGEVLWIIPGIGWIIGLIAGVLAIIGLIKALQGEWWEIPIIGSLAKKVNL